MPELNSNQDVLEQYSTKPSYYSYGQNNNQRETAKLEIKQLDEIFDFVAFTRVESESDSFHIIQDILLDGNESNAVSEILA